MLIKTQLTTPLQIVCEFMIISEVIFKSIKCSEDNCLGVLNTYVVSEDDSPLPDLVLPVIVHQAVNKHIH